MATSSARSPRQIVLAGARGFGLVHRHRLAELEAQGRVVVTGLVDPVLAVSADREDASPVFPSLRAAVARVGVPTVVVVASPIATHYGLARDALEMGAHVLLEKPPVTGLGEFDELLRLSGERRRSVQVGFQSLGSHALRRFDDDAFGIGEVRAVRAVGLWRRSVDYWHRSPWAGRRWVGATPIMDGVVTNPLAHAVATALRVARSQRLEHIDSVEVELYRANAIDADDTSSVRIVTRQGITIACALTLCAPDQEDAVVTVAGAHGERDFRYVDDIVQRSDGQEAIAFGRTGLLENLLDHIDSGMPLLSPLVDSGGYMRVLQTIRDAPRPTPIGPDRVEWRGTGADRHAVVVDIGASVRAAAGAAALFSEVAAPFAFIGHDRIIGELDVGGLRVATVRDGSGTLPTSSPHPFLHPVRTARGVTVTDARPADHPWHAGASFAVPRVQDSNLWGGPTYLREEGYRWSSDHGSQVVMSCTQHAGTTVLRIDWLSHDGRTLAEEVRKIEIRHRDDRLWLFTHQTCLTAVSGDGLVLGSPGGRGLAGSGYGGFFWRFPSCTDVSVEAAGGRSGVDGIHGQPAEWLAWSAMFFGEGDEGEATVAFAPYDEATAGDPWFVRTREYPGVGSAVAGQRDIVIAGGDSLNRSFVVAVADGRAAPGEIADWIALAR
ncbi:MAG: PmoA family protein [Microbacterium sp.]